MMKKYALLIGILFLSTFVKSQPKSNISVEGNLNYYYHFFGETRNMFNYGFSILVYNSFGKVKAGAGIDYSTKYYYFDVTPEFSNNYLYKKEHKLQYIDFPFLVFLGNDINKKFHASAMGGLVISKLVKYDENSYFYDKAPVYESKNTRSNLGLSFRLGAEISTRLGHHIFINLTPFGDYKFILTKDDNRDIPDNNISLGIGIGVEYIFGN